MQVAVTIAGFLVIAPNARAWSQDSAGTIVPLNDPMAPFLESRAVAAAKGATAKGATAEWRKMEWVALDDANANLYRQRRSPRR
jgi:hypothetical protein